MKIKFLQLYKKLIQRKSLKSLDDLYKNDISKLPVNYRINYCISLIYRTKEDIARCKCKLKKEKLKKQLIVATYELEMLNTL